MTLQNIQDKLNKAHRGAFMVIDYQKAYGAYSKRTHAIIRLVNYGSVVNSEPVNSEPTTTTNKVSNDKHLGNNLILNTNTGNIRLMVFPTKSKYHKAKSVYMLNGVEISKEEFLANAKGYRVHDSEPICWCININDIISIG